MSHSIKNLSISSFVFKESIKILKRKKNSSHVKTKPFIALLKILNQLINIIKHFKLKF